MNYIVEIKAFYDWLELNQLPAPAIALWHGLMHINNKTGWKDTFTVAVVVLEIKTGLNKRAVLRARNTLKEKGLIDFEKRGNQAAVYRLNSICCAKNATANGTTSGTANDTANGTTSGTANDTINKRNQTKQNEIIDPPPVAPPSGKKKKSKAASEELNAVWKQYTFPDMVKAKLLEWIDYKKQKGEAYETVIGFKSFLTFTENKLREYGAEEVIRSLDETMANEYKGASWYWENRRKGGKSNGTGRGAGKDTEPDKNRKRPTLGDII